MFEKSEKIIDLSEKMMGYAKKTESRVFLTSTDLPRIR